MSRRLLEEWPDYIKAALLSGSLPPLRDLTALSYAEMTDAERIVEFAYRHLRVPDGTRTGARLEFEPFQLAFLYALYGHRHHVATGILSVARRAGKSTLTSAILAAHIVGPMARQADLVASGAMSKEQSGVIWRAASLMLSQSPSLTGKFKTVPSEKTIVGLAKNVTYTSLAAKGSTTTGRSWSCVVLDEAGAITTPTTDFVDAMRTSQGSTFNSRMITISSQAPTDGAYLSLQLDAAARNPREDAAVFLYTAPSDDLDDWSNVVAANPSLRAEVAYRDPSDIKRQIEEAKQLPSKRPAVLNYLFNRRVNPHNAFLTRDVWQRCTAQVPDDSLFGDGRRVAIGIDLSQVHDLTAVCLAVRDDEGKTHLKVRAWTPTEGMDARKARDRIDYPAWVEAGHLVVLPGPVINYDAVAADLKAWLEALRCEPSVYAFDRWQMKQFQASMARVGLELGEPSPVGMGFRDQSPRVNDFLSRCLQGLIVAGEQPALNLGVASSRVVSDAASNVKVEKGNSSAKADSARNDALIAAIMAAYSANTDTEKSDTVDSYLDHPADSVEGRMFAIGVW